ncbi:GNAT family N-acetyltransferase [Neobacillus dielmonensis]|uniref:GNAT family N-acetyltransferase n=1 Tax=Neobacillus dielmonensis TaxID=1347369 RepID=UPI0005A7C125|nr:GNAT family N-acetyltransferase [Neobacillus dielmonensis]
MTDIEIVNGGLVELGFVYQHFIKDFAVEELKNFEQLESLLKSGDYKLLLAIDRTNHEKVGYAFIYEFIQNNAIWLDYMAIIHKYRNKGYGKILMNKIANYKQDELGVFFEVEIPVEGQDKENQLRRINFYERLSARRLHINYEFPTNNGGFPMYLYFLPSADLKILSKNLIQEALTEAFECIHTDVKNKAKILSHFFSTIEDEQFL